MCDVTQDVSTLSFNTTSVFCLFMFFLMMTPQKSSTDVKKEANVWCRSQTAQGQIATWAACVSRLLSRICVDSSFWHLHDSYECLKKTWCRSFGDSLCTPSPASSTGEYTILYFLSDSTKLAVELINVSWWQLDSGISEKKKFPLGKIRFQMLDQYN